MRRAYSHPMSGFSSSNYQQMGSLGFSISSLWEDFREDTLEPMVDKTLTSVGLSQEQADALKAQAGNAYQQELQNKEKELLAQVTGADKRIAQSTASAPITTQITSGLKDLQQSAVMKAIPGGIYTVVGVLGGLTLYLMLRK